MYRWEDEKWDQVNLQAGYSRNDRRCMETYFVIPANKGKFHVYLEADGEFVVKHIGGDLDGSWLGNIAYDVSQRGWNIGNYKGCSIKNYQSKTTFVAGHPDASMNGKNFDAARAVEVDWFASFELECDDDEGSWRIYPPPIQKDSSYNYTVSYGNYTEKYCEWGAVSISIDEDNATGRVPQRIKPRKGVMTWSTPEPERQPAEQTPVQEPSETSGLDAPPTTKQEDETTDDLGGKFKEPQIPEFSTPMHMLARDLGGLTESSSRAPEGVASWVQLEADPVNESEYSSDNETIASPPTTTVSSPFTSIPNTERVLQMPGVYQGDRQIASSVLDEHRKRSFAKRLLPSLGGSRASALSGGTLRQKHSDLIKQYMTAAEHAEAQRIRNQLGKGAQTRYIESLNLHDRV